MPKRNVKIVGVVRIFSSLSGRQFAVRYHYVPIHPKHRAGDNHILTMPIWAKDELGAWKQAKHVLETEGRKVVP